MFAIERFVQENQARLGMLDNGDYELRLATDEIFHLNNETITRIA
jgi:hypothetical protein